MLGLIGAVCFGVGVIATPVPTQRSNGTWSQVESLETARSFARAATLGDGRVICVGGRPDATGWGGFRTTEWYDEATNTWKAGPEMIHARAFFGLVTLTDGRLLAAGGDTTGSPVSTAEIFDGSEWKEAASLPVSKAYFSMVALPGNRAIAIGGKFGNTGTTTVYIYDGSSNTWEETTSTSKPYQYCGATLLQDGTVMVAGGFGSSSSGTPVSSVEIYDPTTKDWEIGPSLNVARFSLRLVTLPSGKVVAGPGGLRFDSDETPSLGDNLKDVELYDPATKRWESIAPIPTAVRGYGMTLLPSGAVLVVSGKTESDVSTKIAQVLTIESSGSYRCLADACVEVAAGEGVPKEECEKVCGEPVNEYECVHNRCVAAAGGVSKDTCERICRPPSESTFSFEQ